MHSRNIYKHPLNFVEICRQFPELVMYTKTKPNGKIIFNFKDRDALRCLCTILLKRDFQLQVVIPEDTLVPTLPLRLNYILWIEDLLQKKLEDNPTTAISGIDIGTGATCIYPLLIAKKNGWKMTGIDIEDNIVELARENVKINKLDNLISILKGSSSPLKSLPSDEAYDFCMCNPPFFDSMEHELPLPTKRNRAARQREARLQVSGTTSEISSPGGEVTFIKNIIEDSKELGDRITIYTSMIGCKSSVQPILDTLKANDIHSYCETQFCQGRTMRWAVAWTFTDTSLKSSLLPKKKRSKPIVWSFRSEFPFKDCVKRMDRMFQELQVQFSVVKESKNATTWQIKAHTNTWTGLRKKRREQRRKEETNSKCDIEKSSEVQNESTRELTSVDVTVGSNKRKADFEDLKDNDDCKKARTDQSDGLVLAAEIESKRKSNDSVLGAEIELKHESNDSFLDAEIELKHESNDSVLEAEIELKRLHGNKDANIKIEIAFIEGQKEAPQQIMQFFKNNLIRSR